MSTTENASSTVAAHHDEPNYMLVFGVLFVLTIVEVGVVFLPIAKVLIAIMLVGLALTKAICVAVYFMHLKFEKRTLAAIAVTPLLLCTYLVLMLLPDAM